MRFLHPQQLPDQVQAAGEAVPQAEAEAVAVEEDGDAHLVNNPG